MLLTGNIRYRRGWGGKMVLQVEEIVRDVDTSLRLSPFIDRMRNVQVWRDADFSDVQHLADLREPEK